MSDAAERAERLLTNPISKRLADGWYPSGRNADGEVVHDRHVLIWVRNYEATIRDLLAEIAEEE
jgi:hypothetical protein